MHHYVFSERQLCSGSQLFFCRFEKVLRRRFKATFLVLAHPRELLERFIDADVLVLTGSSFSLVAAQLGSKEQILLMSAICPRQYSYRPSWLTSKLKSKLRPSSRHRES